MKFKQKKSYKLKIILDFLKIMKKFVNLKTNKNF